LLGQNHQGGRCTAARAMERTPRYKIPESVLVVIHTPEREVLLIERADKPGYWQSVTGSKDRHDESLRDVAIREVAEETGIRIAAVNAPGSADAVAADADPTSTFESTTVPLTRLRDWGLVNVYEIYPMWRHRYAPGVVQNTEHVFGLTVPRGTPVLLAPREHLRYEWLPWREAADRCFSPSNAEAILQLPRFA
jgi:dATP pyrophosphohydrolase